MFESCRDRQRSAAFCEEKPLAHAQSAFDLDHLTATQAAPDICAGKYPSVALVTAALTRAKARPELNAFIMLDEAGALEAARACDAAHARGEPCKPLGGVPIAIKDNIEVAGLPATAGTPALKGYIPAEDAPVVAKLRAAGAIIIGKTNMHELAFGVSGYNTAFKTGTEFGVRNAYDTAKIAGGSSSGNAAAIGARTLRAQRRGVAAADRRTLSARRHRADFPHPRYGGGHGGVDRRCRSAGSHHHRRTGNRGRRLERHPARRRRRDDGEPR